MVKAFRFARLPEIIFRVGGISELPSLLKRFGEPVLLVTGRHSFTGSERGQNLLSALEKEKIAFSLMHIAGEPSPAVIDNATASYGERGIKCVVAIGGGSVLDAGKAVSAMLRVKGSVKDYLEGVGTLDHPGIKVPFIAVPTTAGTGSEATKNAVISEVGPDGFKKSLRHDALVPDIALLDPALTLDCPPGVTAASGMDSFTQLTEAFLSTKASEYTDAFAWMGLKAIKSSLLTAVKDGSDMEARTGMSLAALNSGICLANAGLGTVHGFASVLGGKYDLPHGLICGSLMAVTNRVNVRELRRKDPASPALAKYARLGELFLDTTGKSQEYYIDGFVEYLFELTSELGLHAQRGSGPDEKDLEEISARSGNKNNPVELSPENRLEILEEWLGLSSKLPTTNNH